jgi:hypothetical protein
MFDLMLHSLLYHRHQPFLIIMRERSTLLLVAKAVDFRRQPLRILRQRLHLPPLLALFPVLFLFFLAFLFARRVDRMQSLALSPHDEDRGAERPLVQQRTSSSAHGAVRSAVQRPGDISSGTDTLVLRVGS